MCNTFLYNERFHIKKAESIYIFSCGFNADCLDRKLFSRLGIECPKEIKRSVIKRQSEFLAGRYAAKQAITKGKLCNSQIFTIPIGPQRNPIWPNGILGSITHNDSVAMCAVTSKNHADYIGIDLEPMLTAKIALELESSIVNMFEMDHLLKQGIPYNVSVTLAFSAKESLFKALYCHLGEYFDFSQALISVIHSNNRTIEMQLDKRLADKHDLKQSYLCHYNISDQSVYTSISGRF